MHYINYGDDENNMSTQRSLLNNTIMPIIFCIMGHICPIVKHARAFIYNFTVLDSVQVILLLYILYTLYCV